MVRVYTPEGLQRLREGAAALRAVRAEKAARRVDALRALESVAGVMERTGSAFEILSLLLFHRLGLLTPKQQRCYADFVHVFGPNHAAPVLNRAVAELHEIEARRADEAAVPAGGD